MSILPSVRHITGRSSIDSQRGHVNSIKQDFLESSNGPVGCLACPARFERATWALEAGKMI